MPAASHLPLASSSITIVDRPVWRAFSAERVKEAAAHVRAGGFSALTYATGAIKVLLPRGRDGALTELALWALLAIDLRRWGAARGPARGLAAVWIKKEEDRDIIREWCERDAGHPGATYRIELDCMACGACCRDNRVVLEEGDKRAWKRAGRDDLLSRAYLKRSKGEVVLRLTPTGRCVHLGHGNRCSIYRLRPSNCSVFPVGAEPCLSSREETLGIVD